MQTADTGTVTMKRKPTTPPLVPEGAVSDSDGGLARPGTWLDEASLVRLMTWLSPSYPIGAFSYSHGLEYGVEAGIVRDAASLGAWILEALRHGAARVDASLLVAAWRAAAIDDLTALDDIADLAAAWRGTAELGIESSTQGDAFLAITETAWHAPLLATFAARRQRRPTALPVAVAVAAAAHRVPLLPATVAFLHGFASALVSAGIRLGLAGHTAGQRIVASLEPDIARAAAYATTTPLEEVGSAAPIIDWCSMRHETQYTRLFRS